MSNDAVVLPWGTVTDAGIEAMPVLLDLSVIVTPPAGAGLLRVTVPVAEGLSFPPTTEVGSTLMENVTPRTVMSWVMLVGPRDAVIDVVRSTAMVCPVTINVPELAPAGTMTVLGTLAIAVLPECRFMTTPPAGAGALMVTVPVAVAPPSMIVGVSV
jgi:hypothetical protein